MMKIALYVSNFLVFKLNKKFKSIYVKFWITSLKIFLSIKNDTNTGIKDILNISKKDEKK